MSEEAIDIKELIKKEYVKCSQDPIHFMKKYCYISHPVRGRILFHLYPFQEKVLSLFGKHEYTILNKSRQLGISTLVAGYSLWLMLFNKEKTILCIATKQETAKGMVTKVKFMYDNLPSWLKGKNKPLEDNKLSIKLANGSQIIAASSSSDTGRSYAVSLLIIDEAAFVDGIDRIYTSIMPTLATGGGCIALSSPNGVGNWFHTMWTKAENGEGSFLPIRLPWNLHPERDQAWYDAECANMTKKEIAQEYECDFLASGNTVVDPESLEFYEKTYISEPIEKRFMGNDFWIWKYADFSKQYLICADVARGDSSDYSTAIVIDVEACEQVAEYKSQIGTRDFGAMLVSIATEYNNALIGVDNSNIGWDVVSTIIERGYQNLYYSPRSYGDANPDKFLYKIDHEQSVPGFTMSTKSRPLVVSKMESYIREKTFIFHSKRLLSELRVFVWLNGKAQSMNGYNDDLVMALGIGLFLRDTAIKYNAYGNEMTKASIDGWQRTEAVLGPMFDNRSGTRVNPYIMQLGNGQNVDITDFL